MSLYADYIKEHRSDEIIERNDGFATYRYIDDNGIKAVYIIDVYVRPSLRGTSMCVKMVDEIITIARSNQCKEAITSVVPSAANSTYSLRLAIKYGFTLCSATNNLILFKKEI